MRKDNINGIYILSSIEQDASGYPERVPINDPTFLSRLDALSLGLHNELTYGEGHLRDGNGPGDTFSSVEVVDAMIKQITGQTRQERSLHMLEALANGELNP